MELQDTVKKRKREKSIDGSDLQPERTKICMLHFEASKSDSFTYLSQTKDAEQRFQRLHNIRELRLKEPPGSASRMESACDLIPDDFTVNHGYHRDCYQRFTMNLNRLTKSTTSNPEAPCTSRSSRSSAGGSKPIFDTRCIFCNSNARRKVKIKSTWTTEPTSRFEFDGGENIRRIAEMKKDEQLLVRIRGMDLFACEAQYHRSFRRKYIADPRWWRSQHDSEIVQQMQLNEAHNQAYSAVCNVIDTDILCHNQVMKLTDLCDVYVASLDETDFPNKKYRSGKLKDKLQSSPVYCNKLCFTKLEGRGQYQPYLVFSCSIDIGTAVRCAYTLGTGDPIKEVALTLRTSVLNAFQEARTLSWPPTAQHFSEDQDVIPDDMTRFLSYLFTGKLTCQTTKVRRLIWSIGQDICRASTNGKWKLPKHIVLCMTLRHLFRSAELITLINRFGHSESYSFSLELETALSVALQQASSLLSTQIIRNPSVAYIFHSDFDNFDQLVNDLSGAGSIHTAHGIMIQDVEGRPGESGGTTPDIPSITRTGDRSLKMHQVESLPECYVAKVQAIQSSDLNVLVGKMPC